MIFLFRLVGYINFWRVLIVIASNDQQWRSSKLMILYDPDASQQSVIIPHPQTMDSDCWRFHTNNCPSCPACNICPWAQHRSATQKMYCSGKLRREIRELRCPFFVGFSRFGAFFLKSCFFRCNRCRMRFRGSWLCRLFLPNLRLKVLNYSHSIDICWVLAWTNPLKNGGLEDDVTLFSFAILFKRVRSERVPTNRWFYMFLPFSTGQHLIGYRSIDALHVSMHVHVHQQSGQREKGFKSKCVARDTEQIQYMTWESYTAPLTKTEHTKCDKCVLSVLLFSIVVWILLL